MRNDISSIELRHCTQQSAENPAEISDEPFVFAGHGLEGSGGAQAGYAGASLTEGLQQKCQKVVEFRRARERVFGSAGLFSDPAWDILLDLFIAQLQHKPVSVTSAAVASGVPTTTALRWLSILEQNGLIMREPDPLDGRRVHVKLTAACVANLQLLLESV